jgi:hypothetical protein
LNIPNFSTISCTGVRQDNKEKATRYRRSRPEKGWSSEKEHILSLIMALCVDQLIEAEGEGIVGKGVFLYI